MKNFARWICLAFGFIDLVGTFWYQESLGGVLMLFGFLLSFSEFFVGLLSSDLFKKKQSMYMYLFICVAGIILSGVFLYDGIVIGYGPDWFAVAVRVVLIFCFLVLFLNMKKRMSGT